jgi:hypothetical protein
MPIIFANNAISTLASSISGSATTLSIKTNDGSLFPSPTGDNYFIATILSASDQTTNEIIFVTSRNTDTFTITRAQEGTSARSWSAGDYIRCMPTAGTMGAFLQSYTPPTASSSTAGVVQLATLSEANAATNTTKAVTPADLATIISNTATNTSNISTNTTNIALKANIANPIFTGTPAAPTASTGTSTTQLATTAFVSAAISAISGGSSTMSTNGGVNFPSWLLGGLQIRWGRFTASANASTSTTFEMSFTTACFACQASGVNSGTGGDTDNMPAVIVDTISTTGFTVFSASDLNQKCTYIAIGH